MLLRDNHMRALKGFIHSEIIDSKKLYIITGAITLGSLIISAFIDILMLLGNSMSNNNGGVLTIGFVTVAISMFISAIVSASKNEIRTAFTFPLNRKIYVFGNCIMFMFNAIGLLLLTSMGYLLECAIFGIISGVYDNFIYINPVTPETYLVGFWISFCYIITFTMMTYFIFLIFNRYKLPAVIIFVLMINVPFIFAAGRNMYFRLSSFFIEEQFVTLLSMKLLGLAFIFLLASYLVLRTMEVNK